MESRRLRFALLCNHEELLGKAKSFDGSILFLPHRLSNTETVLWSESKKGEKVQITVTLTNELPPSSPVCLQFYKIIFKRILKILNMQQIGRHYYNPEDPLNIPQHRNASAQTTLSTWGLSFENKLLNLTGRVLPAERILQGVRAYEYNPWVADWSKEM
ncbi:hypothetical protein AMELA_G00216310 [Ameiurus melas]|uniref:Uncharacterized protein n=1 Tax=Ameiurus melas TaxID=219545 RepID=A0A7J6A1G4_AMEME|nr:hypothetical protein AMELA_G00216310 [Ameiurus melas]